MGNQRCTSTNTILIFGALYQPSKTNRGFKLYTGNA